MKSKNKKKLLVRCVISVSRKTEYR
jgi:hypothetical protein